jgi:hypothetical protein
MVEPIVSRDTIRAQAQAAAERGQNVNVSNPYPAGSAAHAAFERDYWAAVHELEIEAA